MSGIYLHIPFCKKTCHYCDFHFSTSLKSKDMVMAAMLKEISDRKGYLEVGATINTIYFGGGTPSMLNVDELNRLFDRMEENFDIKPNAEITLEANPDDLTPAKIKELRHTPVNRLSVGVQSFFDEDLKLLNRAHNAKEAQAAILRSQDAGLENITLDLIYAIPGLSDDRWKQNMETALGLQVPHISAYCLTVEEKTPLEAFIRKGEMKPIDEEASIRHFTILMDKLQTAGFEHYEISNFAKPDFHSRHNSAYWSGEKYLGIGPSAHSFDGESRQWNVAHNVKYALGIEKGQPELDREVLSEVDKVNELILTRLRLMKGLSIAQVSEQFNGVQTEILESAQPWLESGHLLLENEHLLLSHEGKFVADRIASDLFI